MSRISIIFFMILTFLSITYSQVSESWVATYDGPGKSTDFAHKMVVDLAGNTYVTGQSIGSGTGFDYATIKYNSAGVQEWLARYNGPGNGIDIAEAIAIDLSGNIYVTGLSQGSAGDSEYATIKYDNNGNQLWVARYVGTGSGQANSIAVDLSGNVYVNGTYNHNIVTVKYNSSGVQQWASIYVTGNSDNWTGGDNLIQLDADGNVYVTGHNTIQSSGESDIIVIKYSPAGNQQWLVSYAYNQNYNNQASAFAVDGNKNVYVTGSTNTQFGDANFLTFRINSGGSVAWSRIFSTSYSSGFSLTIDGCGYVYAAGHVANSYLDLPFALVKYSPTGVQQWMRTYSGNVNSMNIGYAIKSDICSNIYVTGITSDTGNTPNARFAMKYNSNGTSIWTDVHPLNIASSYWDEGTDVALDLSGNVFSTGGKAGEPQDYVTLKYAQDFYTVSGLITYSDNGQNVSSGFAKALYYDRSSSTIIVEDSSGINQNGTYSFRHFPHDSLYIMVYQNDDGLDFVPTYYPSTIDWQQAVLVDPSGNLNNINVQVTRINNGTNPYSVSGSTTTKMFGGTTTILQDAIVYAKMGNNFLNYGISNPSGNYAADKLPNGTYLFTAYRIGFNSSSQSVVVNNGNLNSVNFSMSGGITNVQSSGSNVPVSFKLYQNYPNPFNPSTKIKFDIPSNLKMDKVQLEVYDMLGRKVATLVNGQMTPGSYEMDWNASNYASGIYFYRITAGSFNDTKRMVLVK